MPMRWKTRRDGDRRIKSFFAWLPAWIRSTDDNVWLERVTVEQIYEVGKPSMWMNEREIAPGHDA